MKRLWPFILVLVVLLPTQQAAAARHWNDTLHLAIQLSDLPKGQWGGTAASIERKPTIALITDANSPSGAYYQNAFQRQDSKTDPDKISYLAETILVYGSTHTARTQFAPQWLDVKHSSSGVWKPPTRIGTDERGYYRRTGSSTSYNLLFTRGAFNIDSAYTSYTTKLDPMFLLGLGHIVDHRIMKLGN